MKPAADKQNCDQTTADIIRELNKLLLKAQMEKISTLASILEDARDSIVWWAVEQDYDSPRSDQIMHDMALENAMHIAISYLAKFAMLTDNSLREELLLSMKIPGKLPKQHKA